MGHARVVHEVIGRLLNPTSEPPEARCASVIHSIFRESEIGAALQADIR